MHDSIEVDDHGKPGAAIMTRPFVPTANAIANIRGLPDYAFAIVDHPIGSLPADELAARARAAAPQVARILLGE